ncbi:oxygen-independent coproporphyrinogen III oxidase [Pseudoruegeria sp. SK021]|uniref:oxygen-independent coproporphyrinogen III oxidase n=1 Tax=Pseudoruegeria sp. SK021 TaxID=1933035 RepID=UPI000A23F497|nr:oxygen-independent coproporphyrinogen III oxidase [Pseudoruegeria sp. SK021]OSP56747.1 oxygen-independent coproporphyrinogen III oxidase [Pseudoruegeria sp. SK021]
MTHTTQLSQLGLFDRKVPRYTSYPTAPQFSDRVGGADMARWIAAVPPGSAVSLYIHVPFCRRLCWFCACRTQGTRNMATVRAYLETLKAEIALVKQHLAPGIRLSRLHWGGGTPTLLPPEMIAELAATLADLAPMAPGGEFSVEIDPNEIDTARMAALKAAGMTRASIGVQDFDPAIQRAIGRDQGFELTRDVAAALRAHGIASLNADILFGLPHQTSARITDTVQKLLALNPDRVALYGYAHVPWMARRQAMIDPDTLPDPKARLHLFDTARRLFRWDGYEEIGIDHFARPHDTLAEAARQGQLRRNFQGYTDDAAPVLIGLGASAISQFPAGYAQNAAATGDYTRQIRTGALATSRGHRLSPDDRMRSRMIESLMCNFAIDPARISAETGAPLGQITPLLRGLAQTFAAVVDLGPDGSLTIRREGRPLTRLIAHGLDAYAAPDTGHSSAI